MELITIVAAIPAYNEEIAIGSMIARVVTLFFVFVLSLFLHCLSQCLAGAEAPLFDHNGRTELI